MSIPYWPESLPQSPATDANFEPVDVSARFDAEVGEQISRPRTTSAPFMLEAEWFMTNGQISTFEDFFAKTLGQGSQRFAYRDVISGTVRMWRFTSPYKRQFLLKSIARVKATIMMLPGVPWFAPYAKSGLSTVPAFVADYENNVFGVDGKRTPASAVTNVSGTYLVQRTTRTVVLLDAGSNVLTTDGEVIEASVFPDGPISLAEETLVAGDITASAPPETLRIIGWPI